MKSGLEGRNNLVLVLVLVPTFVVVSMKSGLEGRNNFIWTLQTMN